ncbi:alpha/beta fold hydrolase [Novosphingobium pentaromativorans]|uniref:Alpha/beta hydrolase fold protein n=1 Tax=Novosphingobium pentaromativorans US6-1 TaxID=1088721 RepID=G6E777_9SPHN|nr:alpha/beta hydrolase [Novosphingobium pentaromativorans]AIT81714.1 alpha/beta hydrolase [Novosphingobium pentaromativorans US6-1]EHJ62700.1 alpha/beta hydrolase fold protein [Novosphingobium pentaromativorans US6-1]
MERLLGPTSNRFASQRLRLNYVDWGNPDAPPLILQHGGRDHCRSWDWVAEELRHEWHVICPDLRGHGDSEWSPEGNYAMDGYVYDFAQLVHTLGYEKVTIIAHSLGGNIATRFAGLYPEKVDKLVNIEGLGPTLEKRRMLMGDCSADRMRDWISKKRDAAGRIPRKYNSLREAYERMKTENAFLTVEQARHLTVHGASRNEDGTWSWKFDNYLNVWPIVDLPGEHVVRLWEAITCPVLMLWGKDSFASSPALDGRMDHFSTASLIEYDNAGHWLHHDQFDRFMADVKAFLAS